MNQGPSLHTDAALDRLVKEAVVVEALRSPAGQRHNGCTARVTAGLDPASGRCTVVLDASGEQIKVKPANIRAVRQRCRAL